jgi:hypothetical protein
MTMSSLSVTTTMIAESVGNVKEMFACKTL